MCPRLVDYRVVHAEIGVGHVSDGMTCEGCGSIGHESLRRLTPVFRGGPDDLGIIALMSLPPRPGIMCCDTCTDGRHPPPIYPNQVSWKTTKGPDQGQSP